MRRVLSWPIKLLRGLWIGLIGLILIFEEWGWEPLARLLAWVGQLPGLRWLEARIRTLPPYGALAMFAMPILTLLPLKLLALYWLGHGHTALGIGVIVAAKLGGTAITARLFMLTQASLMHLAWFARWFGRWMVWKTRILAQVKGSALWRSAHALAQRVRQWMS